MENENGVIVERNPFDDESTGIITRFLSTVNEVLFHPGRFFETLDKNIVIGNVYLYYLVIVFLGYLFSFFWQNFTGGNAQATLMMQKMLSENGVDNAQFLAEFSSSVMLFYYALMFLFSAVMVFITSGFYHILMLIFGEGENGFNATFASVAFASTPVVFLIVPFCGGLISAIWSIVVAIIGFSKMQNMSTGKAALIYFIPTILMMILVVLLIGLFAGFIMNIAH